MAERQITFAPFGHMLTHAAIWSADSRWIVYDTRSGVDGSVFDGTRIERVELETGRIERLHESSRGACCGVATTSPVDDRVVFIQGPEDPTADWRYGAARRQGMVVRPSRPGAAEPLDARDLVPPYTPGALRGGSHVHLFSPDGQLVSFTYEDAVLEAAAVEPGPAVERSLRGIGVTICGEPVTVPRTHPRNHDGSGFSVLLARLHDHPRPGSDQISRACEEAWVGRAGYLRRDGSRQRYALAFQGDVMTREGRPLREVFLLDLPERPADLRLEGVVPLTGTPTRRPAPPRGVVQRRLTDTTGRLFPGIDGPRHWLRSSPDGGRIGFLARDAEGVVQIFTVGPNARPEARSGDDRDAIRQVTRDPFDVTSAFSWSPCGRRIAYAADGSVFEVEVETGRSDRLTEARDGVPRPEACVHSPDGLWVAFMRTVPPERDTVPADRGPQSPQEGFNQIFVVAATTG